MSHQAVVSAPLSRPKIHRFPAATPRRRKISLNPVLLRTGLMITALVIVVMMIGRLMNLTSTTQLSVTNTLKNASPSPVSTALAAVSPEKMGGNTIVITGKTGTIVGQMARIPSQNEQITEVKPVTEVDNRGGPDLLSIIGKY